MLEKQKMSSDFIFLILLGEFFNRKLNGNVENLYGSNHGNKRGHIKMDMDEYLQS